jgi:hypothetical protein
MQASLAILGSLLSVLVGAEEANIWWLAGGVFLVSVVPFILIVVMPTNRQLLDPSLNKNSDRTAPCMMREVACCANYFEHPGSPGHSLPARI